jgi:hypothetical protein
MAKSKHLFHHPSVVAAADLWGWWLNQKLLVTATAAFTALLNGKV